MTEKKKKAIMNCETFDELLDQEYGPIKESPSRGEGKPLTKEQIDSRRDFISSNF